MARSYKIPRTLQVSMTGLSCAAAIIVGLLFGLLGLGWWGVLIASALAGFIAYQIGFRGSRMWFEAQRNKVD